MSAASVDANPNVGAQQQGGPQMNFSGKDALIGGLIGTLFGSPIAGAGIGGFVRSLFSPNAGDMDKAYDANRATAGAQTFDFGPLKGMADGLFGMIRDVMGGAGAQQHQKAQANGEYSNQPQPETHADAQNTARPGAGPEVQQQAQQSSSPGWGKALKWGGLALAGLTLLNNVPFMGGFGMPFFGGGLMNPMMNPMMGGFMF